MISRQEVFFPGHILICERKKHTAKTVVIETSAQSSFLVRITQYHAAFPSHHGYSRYNQMDMAKQPSITHASMYPSLH
jgi:hypothetical protein